MFRIFKSILFEILKMSFNIMRHLLVRKKTRSLVFFPIFGAFDEMIDSIYRLTWYLPKREGLSVIFCYHGFTFNEVDLLDDSNRPSHMHSLPVNIDNLKFRRINSLQLGKIFILFKAIFKSKVLVWEEHKEKSYLRILLKLTGNVLVINHKIISYKSDIRYVSLLLNLKDKDEIKEIISQSKSLFFEQVELLRRFFNKVYIFGRGPSLGYAPNFDFSDGARIVCNQIVGDKKLMKHIDPHFIAAQDHCWHYGCSKMSDKFREDLLYHLRNSNSILLLNPDQYILMEHHYPNIKNKMIAIPYANRDHNFNLTEEFNTKGTYGVFFEILLPVACTIANNVKMLGFDGTERPDEELTEYMVPLPHYKIAAYPDEVVNSIHESRPGYYERDFTDYRKKFDELVEEIVSKAVAKGFNLETLAPSYHSGLEDKYKNALQNVNSI